MSESYKSEWVQPVRETIVWICQLPRTGGTLLLRLLDSHPQVHCYPAVFGFNTPGKIWPDGAVLENPRQALEEIFSYMNLAKFHMMGIQKQSSNMPQKRYPIYFDGGWYRDIYYETVKENSPRGYFDAFFTALFNAWRNNQNLYGNKKIITGQMTLRDPGLYNQNFRNFRQAYPEGKMVFMVRDPGDWLASALNLRKSTPFSQNPEEVMGYYKTIVRQAVQMGHEGELIMFRFEDLLQQPEKTMRWLARQAGLNWNDQLLAPTFNGAPFFQNSSFEVDQKAEIDPSIIGRGRHLEESALSAIDKDVLALYQNLLSLCPAIV